MDRKHKCNLCFRRFPNGRALGGHMRSHVVAASHPKQKRLASSSASSTSNAELKPEETVYRLRENPRRSFRVFDPAFSSSVAGGGGGASPVAQDGDCDTGSSQRLKRARPREDPSADAEPLSSITDAAREEEVARCLVLLSRNAWAKSEAKGHQSNGWKGARAHEEEEIYCDEEEKEAETEAEERAPAPAAQSCRKRSRYQCSTCRKYFRSYQALGGHRANHKRVKAEHIAAAGSHIDVPSISSAAVGKPKLFECPYCYKTFSSGQAFDGHKRSHFTSTTAIAAAAPARPPRSPIAINVAFLDLNLPPPSEEEAEASAISITSHATK